MRMEGRRNRGSGIMPGPHTYAGIDTAAYACIGVSEVHNIPVLVI